MLRKPMALAAAMTAVWAGCNGDDTTPAKAGGSGTNRTGSGATVAFGERYEGGEFHLGPVDYEESKYHNACAPQAKYASRVREAQGQLLAGLWNGLPNVADLCDACIQVTTGRGKSAVLRVVTYGETSKNSIDVSPEAFAILDSGEHPRTMSWQLAKCPETGPILYEVQTGSSEWWTSLWVRGARSPLKKVEVKSENHGDFVALARGSDGTLTDASGFGKGPFTIRLTSIDDQVHTDSFDWPSAGIAGQMLVGSGNFP